jgi:hypothetical protein
LLIFGSRGSFLDACESIGDNAPIVKKRKKYKLGPDNYYKQTQCSICAHTYTVRRPGVQCARSSNALDYADTAERCPGILVKVKDV